MYVAVEQWIVVCQNKNVHSCRKLGWPMLAQDPQNIIRGGHFYWDLGSEKFGQTPHLFIHLGSKEHYNWPSTLERIDNFSWRSGRIYIKRFEIMFWHGYLKLLGGSLEQNDILYFFIWKFLTQFTKRSQQKPDHNKNHVTLSKPASEFFLMCW